MKKTLTLVLFFILTNLFLPKVLFAQTPTPFIRVDCGYAGDLTTSKCCETKVIDYDKVGEAAKNLSVGSAIIDKLSQIKIEEKIPFINDVIKKCYLGEPDESSGACICKQTEEPTPVLQLANICEKYSSGAEKANCLACTNGGGILTAMGCVPLNIGNFISDFLLARLIGLAGIIAMICIIYSAFQLQTSRGNPEKIKKAQELLTSCIMGLMLIIFSIFILRLIGVDILKIPGLSG